MDSSVTWQRIADVEKAKAKGMRRMGDALPMGNTPRVKATERVTTEKVEKAKDRAAKAVTFLSVTENATNAGKRVTLQPTARPEEPTKSTRDPHRASLWVNRREKKLPMSIFLNRRA